MIGKVLIIAVLCVACILAEAPAYRYRAQRLRQSPPRQFFARQEAAPYPDSQRSHGGGEPASEYGPPPTHTPSSQYGPPPSLDAEIPSESANNPEAEAEALSFAGQPSRLQSFAGQPSRLQSFTGLPTKPPTFPTFPTQKPHKLSQRLELQQQVHQYQNQQFQPTPVVSPFQQLVAAAPVQQVVAAAPVQLAAIQQDGSYFIQLPNGAIQRVNYVTQPNLVDNSVLAKLQFRPVAGVQATVADPQLYVNTVVQSHVSSDE